MTKKQRTDTYQIVTDTVIAALDSGVVPWQKPWQGGWANPRSLTSGNAYRGVNTFLLGLSPFTSPWWGTYNQIKKNGGQVRKGEHGTPIVFWKVIEKKNVEGEVEDRIFFLRYYKVFNVEQADWEDGLPARVLKWEASQPKGNTDASLDVLDEMIAAYENGPKIARGGDRAYYAPATDNVTVPETKFFVSPAAEFGTVAHELVHSTGHKSRLDRLETATFGTEPYAKEELVAEMGAAFLAAVYGVTDDSRLEQSAAYIAGWRKAISDDPKLVVSAAGKAQAAVEHMIATAEAEENETAEAA